ncbi:unnamed protein product [Spirodela intermedia]|uniref:Uncharacterized protein n=1 Tax=Spirodela intermedia TaxID=51605 RepID=A0A7I8LL34_SPIIN|nr:unnamed protein product [Spirodela intermedia]
MTGPRRSRRRQQPAGPLPPHNVLNPRPSLLPSSPKLFRIRYRGSDTKR